MKDIINQVKSPFTDKMVEKLIKQYISWDGDMVGFCKKINEIDGLEMVTNPYLKGLNDTYCIQKQKNWNIILSDKNYLRNNECKEQLYKIYLNLKGEDKANIIKEYIQKCEEKNKDYKLKFAEKDGRNDEIIFMTDEKNLTTDIDIIKKITQQKQKGKLPMLVGIYNNEIGITEEYTDAPYYNYTESRLDMIPKSIAKYILDNSLDIIKYCNTKQIKLISEMSELFKKYTENIVLGQIGYGIHIVIVKELIKPLRKYMDENSSKALPDMVSNFKMSCQVNGISEQGVFSTLTEQKIQEEPLEEKSLEELQNELEKLVQKERKIAEKKNETKMIKEIYQNELYKAGNC